MTEKDQNNIPIVVNTTTGMWGSNKGLIITPWYELFHNIMTIPAIILLHTIEAPFGVDLCWCKTEGERPQALRITRCLLTWQLDSLQHKLQWRISADWLNEWCFRPHSALLRYTGPESTQANEVNFVMSADLDVNNYSTNDWWHIPVILNIHMQYSFIATIFLWSGEEIRTK